MERYSLTHDLDYVNDKQSPDNHVTIAKDVDKDMIMGLKAKIPEEKQYQFYVSVDDDGDSFEQFSLETFN